MNEYPPAPVQAESEPYYDRSTGLMVFGIMTTLLGALSALLSVLTVVSLLVASALPNSPPMSVETALPAVCMYVGLAVALIWLGIGSMKARRWARALLLVFSWSWLIVGVLDLGMLAFILPKVMANLPTPAGAQPVPPGVMTVLMIFTFIFTGIIMVVLPSVWLFFYSSRHVRLTCEWHDPVVRWTDLCPLPLLGLCLWLGFSGLMMFTMTLMPYIAAPFFGLLVSGMAARSVYLGLGAIWLYAAWLLFRRKGQGWWIALAGCLFFSISAVITYSQHDIMEMYQLMHYPEAQLEAIRKTGLLEGHTMAWLTPVFMLPLLGYMIFIRRYLR